jgi:putative CocE/NonD family hydrolase
LFTSDGIELRADIYHPYRAPETRPTILVRIPYSKTMLNRMFATVVGQMWAERGYTVVIQGTRGRYESEGSYYPLRHERQDGIETLEWLARQPWYNGKIGTWGGSYFGYTQWVIADQNNPGPSALVIQESSSQFYDMFYPGHAFSLQSALHWSVMSRGHTDVAPEERQLKRGYQGLPLLEADDRAVQDIPFFNDWVMHPHRDAYWKQIDRDAAGVQAPVLLMAGWYDPFLPSQLDDFNRIRTSGDPIVARQSRLIIGPWTHADTVSFPDGARPRNYRLESLAPSIDWFDRHLEGVDLPPQQIVRIYVMGIHKWRDEQEWPLARTKYTTFYLHSGGAANSSFGDGKLNETPPTAAEPPDRFTYDPSDPVPTAGGTSLGFDTGIALQNNIEVRKDVLVHSTERLDADLEITGPIQLILHVSTTAPCTDFTAKLVDVYPNGNAFNVSEGILRRQYNPAETDPVEISIQLWPTSTVVRAGHRIRLEVSSSNYPRFDCNLNTGRSPATETQPTIAMQTVYHTSDQPSRLILPIIPSGASDSNAHSRTPATGR